MKELKRDNAEAVARERGLYKSKIDQATLHSSRCISIIIDGVDQSGYGLPHFTFNTKAEPGAAIKVRLF